MNQPINMSKMSDDFVDQHATYQMDPMEDANVTERLEGQSGKISNAFNDMKTDISGEKELQRKEGMCVKTGICGGCCQKDRCTCIQPESRRRNSDVRNKEM
ncbi:hypothetical protein L3Y34_009208 [Caenorhabditis briggsae]|uniref:Uncharacterized protein n=2 Tax=Caenorhabditis briggsae TaxID=6238 RepID=A0AAE9A7V0_CAEBR|nr:hypothetical protein L3Y34_009208 [Caenorhabditis briggsae]